MSEKNIHTGFAIAIAWPETYCKQPGTWYDSITGFLGINKNNYYKAGHAALVLIDTGRQRCHYFDFGRYHSPFQFGRVRSATSDHDLEIKTIPKISSDGRIIENYQSILKELQLNPACHGEGELHASYSSINFNSAFTRTQRMQVISPIPYGPFRYQGSNCSRFVNTVILAGKPHYYHQVKLKYFVPLTPTPMNNVNSLSHKFILPKLIKNDAFFPNYKPDKELLKSTLPQPQRNSKIPKNAQWLSGEGAGSWFDLNYTNESLKVTRYSPSGEIECSGFYRNISSENIFPAYKPMITYPSNCKSVTLLNGESKVVFERIRT